MISPNFFCSIAGSLCVIKMLLSYTRIGKVSSLFCPLRLCGALPASVVHVVVPGEDDLGDGHHFVPVGPEVLQNGGQGLGCVQCGVMEEADGAGLHLAGDPFGDLGGAQFLPVQTVASGNL